MCCPVFCCKRTGALWAVQVLKQVQPPRAVQGDALTASCFLPSMPTISPLRNARIQRLLLDRIQTFHQAHYGVQDSELSQSVLRWMRESQKKQTAKENDMCNAAPLRQLLRMVRDYTEKHKPLAYILGELSPARSVIPQVSDCLARQ